MRMIYVLSLYLYQVFNTYLIYVVITVNDMCMYFSTSINKHCGLPVIYLGNCECQFVNEVKYLGVIIHSSMKTTIDVTRQTKKFYMQANLLLRNFRHCSDDVKCSLFQTYCTNMYCCQLWFNSTKSSINKLFTSYNSVQWAQKKCLHYEI